ncbi:DUF6387 family protein [Kineobactrum salinum]|uniref:Uncharacterized protein n=1 Tax=Kineobactrum salinum TaxID=2708301 RepID=A0A6C0U499_9GAMM|nr:DUF6387 family protein [Kineobactrum salinum]QIB66980.1 hypothetical protein G3T16_17875 [Kineobactrum salinum]
MALTGKSLHKHLQSCVKRPGANRLDHRYYDALADYSINDWEVAFQVRSYLGELLSQIKGGDDSKDWREAFESEFNRACCFTVQEPMPNTDYRRSERSVVPFDYRTADFESRSRAPVRGLEFTDIYSSVLMEATKQRQKIQNRMEELAEFDSNLYEDERAAIAILPWMMERPAAELDRPFCKVDLDFSDKVILEQFAEWLRHARRRRPVYRADDVALKKRMKGWAKNRVLQYADVMLLAGYLGKSLTYNNILNIVYPDRQLDWASPEESVRKIRKSLVTVFDGDCGGAFIHPKGGRR